MIGVGDSAFLVFNTGEKVLYKDGVYTIGDMGFRSDNGSFVSAQYGTLKYLLLQEDKTSIGWISAIEVSMADTKVEMGANSTDDFFDQDTRSPHLEELGYSMVQWLDGLETRPDSEKIPAIVTMLMAIQYDKEGYYGSSWKGKGEYRGIMANIDRKYDRLDKMTTDELAGKVMPLAQLEKGLVDGTLSPDKVGEGKIDAIADGATYHLLYMTYVRENFPKVFNIWVERNVPKYLADKIPFLQESTADIKK